MPRDLPDDIWHEIAEIHQAHGDGTLRQMSLTNRRIRRVVVPVLFRSLWFLISSTTSMVTLLQDYKRVRFLEKSPHLVEHTREVVFLYSDFFREKLTAECLALTCDPPRKKDAWNFFAAIHDSISHLLFRMPRLRELTLHTYMTPLLYAAIYSRPRLIALRGPIVGLIPKSAVVPPDISWKPCLREFSYSSRREMDAYFTSILRQCILDLDKLDIYSIHLPLVVSLIPPNRLLSLRSLYGNFPIDTNFDNLMAFWKLLHATPQLRRLECQFSDVDPTYHVPPPGLQHLSMFYGGPHLLQIVSGGTNLTQIYIAGPFSISAQPLTQIIQSSPSHLRELYIEKALSDTPQALLKFVRSLDVFQNLELLWIDYHVGSGTWEEPHVAESDPWDTIAFLLSRLAHLQVIKIHSDDKYPSNLENFGFFIDAADGDPNDRGWHPTLEAIYVDFLCWMWLWSLDEGWIPSRDWDQFGRSSPWVDLCLTM